MESEIYQSRRYVMRPEQTYEKVDGFATGSGWDLVHQNPRDREAGIDGQLIWSVSDSVALHYIVDATAGIGYVVVTAESAEMASDVERQVLSVLRPWSQDELLKAFDEATEERDRGQYVLRLGLAAPAEFSAEIFARVSRIYAADEPRLRYVGLWAATYTGYQEFVPVIEELLLDDEEEYIRTRAASVVAAFREQVSA